MPKTETRQREQRERRTLGALAVGAITGALIPLVASLVTTGVDEAAPVNVEEPAAAPTPNEHLFIPAGQPLEMYIPAIDLVAGFEQGSCRLVDGLIDPATLNLACTYTAPDRPYRLPGSNAEDIVVVAGHAGAGTDAVFDPLYSPDADHHNVQVGDVMYIRTETSGEYWLKYTVSDLHSPEKESLSQDVSIWGEGATPGRLLTISCIQPAFAPSVRNAVVGWQFAGVAGPGAELPAPLLPRENGIRNGG